MKRYGHDFSMTHAEVDELYVRADPVRLEQILMNLLANAARYTKTRGSIQVFAVQEPEAAQLAIHIRDSGVGIPRGMLERIFEPFFQVDQHKVREEGIGVGLALTRELIELHGGTIEARTRTGGKGSEFIVRLPLIEAPTQSEILPKQSTIIRTAAEPYLNPPKELKRTYRILVVDDNAAASDALSQLLTLRGHTTAVAYSGTEAIQKALEFSPEVVFLDIGLPDMTGYEVAVALRGQDKPYFLVALTGYGQEDDRERARKAGIDQHLTKPAGIKEIQAVLRKYPRSRQAAG
jgi:CheY-like chemotaxis protein